MKLINDKKIKCKQSNHLKLHIINNKLVVSPCCYLWNKILDEIINLDEIDNLYEYLNNVYNNNKKKPFEINNNICKSEDGKCFLSAGRLKSLDISISQSCNLNCKFCCVSNIRTNKYDDLYFKVLNKLAEKECNLEILCLTGEGEPFLYYDKTIDFLKKLNNNITKKIYVITNGTNLNKERIDELYNISKKTGVLIQIQVSLNAFNKDTYKTVMGQDYFDKVIKNILYLKEKELLILVSYVVVKENEKEVEEFENFFKERNIVTTTCYPY